MSPPALVIGGTGPTGPGVVSGLLERGFEVMILHGGQHEVKLPTEVQHIHTETRLGDPFDYAREDDLIGRWAADRRDWYDDAAPFTPTHAYRHPRRPGETWSPSRASAGRQVLAARDEQ
jgi:nucleoside-diphosphate-sugar epimerase